MPSGGWSDCGPDPRPKRITWAKPCRWVIGRHGQLLSGKPEPQYMILATDPPWSPKVRFLTALDQALNCLPSEMEGKRLHVIDVFYNCLAEASR